jgi:hypothetical protein
VLKKTVCGKSKTYFVRSRTCSKEAFADGHFQEGHVGWITILIQDDVSWITLLIQAT